MYSYIYSTVMFVAAGMCWYYAFVQFYTGIIDRGAVSYAAEIVCFVTFFHVCNHVFADNLCISHRVSCRMSHTERNVACAIRHIVSISPRLS